MMIIFGPEVLDGPAPDVGGPCFDGTPDLRAELPEALLEGLDVDAEGILLFAREYRLGIARRLHAWREAMWGDS